MTGGVNVYPDIYHITLHERICTVPIPTFCGADLAACTSCRELVLKLDAEKDIGENPLLVDESASKAQGEAVSGEAAAGSDTDMLAAHPQLDYEQQVQIQPSCHTHHDLCNSYMIPVDVVPRVSAGRLVIGI